MKNLKQNYEYAQGDLLKKYGLKEHESLGEIPGVCFCLTIKWMQRLKEFSGEGADKRESMMKSKAMIGDAWGMQHKYWLGYKNNPGAKKYSHETNMIQKLVGKAPSEIITTRIDPNSKDSKQAADTFMKIKTAPANKFWMIYFKYVSKNTGKTCGHVVGAYTGPAGWFSGPEVTYFDSNMAEYVMPQADMNQFWKLVQGSYPMNELSIQAINL